MSDIEIQELYAASYRRLLGQLVGVTGSVAEAEDVVQEAFVRGLDHPRRLLGADNPEAWLRTVAVNLARSRWRRAQRLVGLGPRLVSGRRAGLAGLPAAPAAVPGEHSRPAGHWAGWAIWHLPLSFLTPLYHSDGNRWLVVPLFAVTIVAGSFVFGYLRLWTGSVWPAALAHSAHNGAWGILAVFTATTSPVVVEEYLVGDNGVLILLGTVLVAGWLGHRLELRGRLRGLAPNPQSLREGADHADVVDLPTGHARQLRR